MFSAHTGLQAISAGLVAPVAGFAARFSSLTANIVARSGWQ
jgi:hypothetical protein